MAIPAEMAGTGDATTDAVKADDTEEFCKPTFVPGRRAGAPKELNDTRCFG